MPDWLFWIVFGAFVLSGIANSFFYWCWTRCREERAEDIQAAYNRGKLHAYPMYWRGFREGEEYMATLERTKREQGYYD